MKMLPVDLCVTAWGLSCFLLIGWVIWGVFVFLKSFSKEGREYVKRSLFNFSSFAMYTCVLGIVVTLLLNPLYEQPVVKITDGDNIIVPSIYIYPGELAFEDDFGEPFGYLQIGNGTIVAEPDAVILTRRYRLKKEPQCTTLAMWLKYPTLCRAAQETYDQNILVINRGQKEFVFEMNRAIRNYINSVRGDTELLLNSSDAEQYVVKWMGGRGWNVKLLELDIAGKFLN